MLSNGDQTLIRQKAKELCEFIVDQPEFKELRRRVDAFLADEEAKNHYQQVVEEGERLQAKQQRGSPLSQQEIQSFESQRSALFNNSIAKGFLDAQQEMHDVRDLVNKYVAKTFELGRAPEEDDFQSCGEGCSCGH